MIYRKSYPGLLVSLAIYLSPVVLIPDAISRQNYLQAAFLLGVAIVGVAAAYSVLGARIVTDETGISQLYRHHILNCDRRLEWGDIDTVRIDGFMGFRMYRVVSRRRFTMITLGGFARMPHLLEEIRQKAAHAEFRG